MSYNTFASFYDELTDNISYPARAAYFDSIIRRWCPKASILLDLACGTGTLSIELARLGYDVVGTDGSEQMLSEAMQNKARALYGEDFEREEPSDPSIERLLFLCQPMQQLDMYGTIDAAVCALDSLNHITDPAVVQKVFDRVSLFMNPGAVFVFDVNSVYKHREVLGNNVLSLTARMFSAFGRTPFPRTVFRFRWTWIFLRTTMKTIDTPARRRAFANVHTPMKKSEALSKKAA